MKRIVLGILLFGVLSAGSCLTTTPVGVTNDFCLVNDPLTPKDQTVSNYLADNDTKLTRGLIVHNTYGERECGWEF